MNKSEVRKKIFQIRRKISDEQVTDNSRKIFETVKEYLSHAEQYGKIKEVYAYASYQHEVDTWEYIKDCMEHGWKVALPRVAVDGVNMDFYYIQGRDDIVSGYKGILEPASYCEKADETRNTDERILIMPGVAFDRKRNRAGYGKGFYDRYLEKHEFACKIAVAFEFQIFDEIECESRDIRPDLVITENGIIM